LKAKSFKFIHYLAGASIYGVYYFKSVAYATMPLVGCTFSSILLTFFVVNTWLVTAHNMASLTVLPCGEKIRIVLFNGQAMEKEISHFRINKVR
jgi:hypothetical protein